MSILSARKATWVWTDSAAGEFQLLRVFPSFDFYSIKSSFFPSRRLGSLWGTHTTFKLPSTKTLRWKQWLMYNIIILIYLVLVHKRTVDCCDEVMYWTEMDGKKHVTCGQICIPPLMAKCFPSNHYPFKLKDRNCVPSKCLRLCSNYDDEQKALERRRELWK